MVINTRHIDWDEIPSVIRKFQERIENSFPEEGTQEEWERFENTPITIGFGSDRIVLPLCAATYNYLTDYLKDIADEMEA